MRYLRTSRGFTLVELVLVMAISSLLLSSILVGSASLQRTSTFSSAVDSVRLALKSLQNEATEEVSFKGIGGALSGTSADFEFGQLVEFDSTNSVTANKMTEWSLVETADRQSLYKCNKRQVFFDQQLLYKSATNNGVTGGNEAVIFGHNPAQTYVVPNFVDGGSSNSGCTQPSSGPPVIPPPPTQCSGITQNNPGGTCNPISTLTNPPSTCNGDPAWQCGLYGQYFRGSSITSSPYSAYIDYQVGQYLDSVGAASSYPSFATTLNARSTAVSTLGAAVHWSGQILLGDEASDFSGGTINEQPHTYCFKADSGTAAQITLSSPGGSGPVYLTNSYTQPTPSPAPATYCQVVQVSTPGWYNIDIQYNHVSGSTPFAQLYEVEGSTNQEVPDANLRTSISNQPQAPNNAFRGGLYGQYYTDSAFGSRIATYTDPLIGDGGSNFSSDSSIDTPIKITGTGQIFPTDNSFSAKLSQRTTKSFPNGNGASWAGVSTKWTGQILVDSPGGVQHYCEISDNSMKVFIDGNLIIDGSGNAKDQDETFCGTTGSLTAGWHNFEADYLINKGNNASAELAYIPAGKTQYTALLKNHLRRPLDWTTDGSGGTCNAAQSNCTNNPVTTESGTAIGEWSSSSSTGNSNSCSKSNNVGQITYKQGGLPPDNTYSMDLSYYNDADGGLPVPSGYSYLVCVAVNGTVLNGGNPVSLPISEPSTIPRTTTLTGISVPSNGKVTITFDWLNDCYATASSFYFGACGFQWGGYDANFGITRVDLFRLLDSAGNLSLKHQQAGRQTVATATSHTSNFDLGWAGKVIPAALASGCDSNIYNLSNYTSNCFAAPTTSTLNFWMKNGSNQQGYIDINTQDNSIERRISD